MNSIVKFLLVWSVGAVKVFAITSIWNWHIAGMGVKFAGEYFFALPNLHWTETLAFFLLYGLLRAYKEEEITSRVSDERIYFSVGLVLICYLLGWGAYVYG